MASLETMKPKKSSLKEGQYIGKLFSIVDIGEQATKFGVIRQVNLTYELQGTAVSKEDQRPLVTSQLVNIASLNEKANLYKTALPLLGGGTEAVSFLKNPETTLGEVLKKILGKSGQLNMAANDKGYVNIKGIAPIGLLSSQVTPAVNEQLLILDCENITPENLARLNEFTKNKIDARVRDSSGEESSGNTPF